jgi:hypothetical protein
MRVYVLDRGCGLPPMVFSTIKKARDWSRTHFPFSTEWRKIELGNGLGEGAEYLPDTPQWKGNQKDRITSVPLDEE